MHITAIQKMIRQTSFAVNKHLEESMLVECNLGSFAEYKVKDFIVLESNDLKATNTYECPNAVVPHNNGKAAAMIA